MYTVLPDDHYYPNTSCHHCHNLQHYLLNITKYFTSNTQLLFLPGLHHLHIDLIIQNVHNISLIGSAANGATLDTVILCNSSVGVVMSNITNLTMVKLVIENCKVNVKRPTFLTIGNGMILFQCYNVQLQNITVLLGRLSRSTILAHNILGISSFINVKGIGLNINYSGVNAVNEYNKLLIKNYIPLQSHKKLYYQVIIIYLHQKSYKVEIEVFNTKFSALNNINRLFKVIQTNKFNDFIHFNQCTVENFKLSKSDLFYFDSPGQYNTSSLQVTFSNCIFRYNELGRLFTVHGEIDMKLERCNFMYSNFQVIRMTKSSYQNSMIITNTSFYSITSDYDMMHISQELYLDGAVMFINLKVNRILYIKNSIITCHGYIEFSQNSVSLIDHTHYIAVQENTLINMTNNIYYTINYLKLFYYASYSTSNYTAPCPYQYTMLGGQNFNKRVGEMNFLIFFHNDASIHELMTAHCRWLPGSAFNSKKPVEVNDRLIKSDLPLLHLKLLCRCSYNNTDCYIRTLATAYPGQTLSLPLILNDEYSTFRDPVIDVDIINKQFITIEINGDVLPPTACKVAKVSELAQQINYTSCTTINFTIVHNGLNYLQWCELFIKIISTHQIEAYYIDILPCPAGFVQHNGICICDPILSLGSIQPITKCDIDHQTILRPPGSWLSAVTTNNSHQYHISSHCPLQYCLPHSSYLNFSTPNSQCQFNRSDMLCGHCQQGLSTVFGYPHCQQCPNVYLLLVIPMAIAGLVLVLLLFFLNLTVTDGDINGFILYVNMISINSHVFFPQYSEVSYFTNFWYSYIALTNLDLGISICFYNGMDDYAKMWLQLAFPAYLILIATLLIIASRHSTKVQRITARRALPVLATLFLLSYTKVLRTVSSVLFYYSTITHLPSGHTTLVWAVDANVPLFGLKYTALFIVCLILFIIILPFNAILCFTKTAMRLKLINHFKPLIDAYQGPYKYKCYFWTGLQLVVRAIFFGLSALDRNINLTFGIILQVVVITIQSKISPFKSSYKNFYELCYLLNLSTVYAFSFGLYNVAVNVMITIAALQFLFIIMHHIVSNVCSEVAIHALKNIASLKVNWMDKAQQNITLNNTPPDKMYNYQELREPLVGQD